MIDNTSPYESRIADYQPMTDGCYKEFKGVFCDEVSCQTYTQKKAYYSAYSGKQPGDPKRAVEIILDLVRGEGVAEGKTVPQGFALGSDCFGIIESSCKETLQVLGEWKEVITSTDFSA